MKRNLPSLANNVYDLLIIGGGIYGACVAWDATLRGLSVALVEKADFCSATSANSLKIIHGGLRYLQHADFKRMRESIRERRTLMRIAPHLIHPMPVLVPTYGHAMQGKEVLYLALMINDLIGFDRNRIEDTEKHIPRGKVISRREVIQLLPGIPQQNLSGGGVFCDAQVYNSERLVLSFLRSAEKGGANMANYVKVIGFLREGDCVTGVVAKDVLTGAQFDIRAKAVVNTAGPWVNQVISLFSGKKSDHTILFAKAINLVTRPLFETYAVGISGRKQYRDADAVINKGNRLFFVVPWHNCSLIGTNYSVYDGDPDDLKVTEKEVQVFLDEINQTYPEAVLRMKDVLFVHCGLLPRIGMSQMAGDIQLLKDYHIYDHRNEGMKGLFSVVSVKYTTARFVAEKAVDQVFESWGIKPPKSTSSEIPLHGGAIEYFDVFLNAEIRNQPYKLDEEMIKKLVYNYGSVYPEVLRNLHNGNGQHIPIGHDALLKAEVLYGVREEMAQKLSDVILRRTDSGTAGYPGNEAIKITADKMETELGWSPERLHQELREINDFFPSGIR